MGYKQETINSLVAKAKRYEVLKLRGQKRLRKYSLFFGLLQPKRLKEKVKHFEWLRSAYTMMSVAAVRKNKLEERARKSAWENVSL